MVTFENIINDKLEFPFEILISDNQKKHIVDFVHWHNCFEIQYLLSGEAEIILNGKKQYLKQGDIVFVKSGDIHTTYCKKDDNTKIMVIKFMPSIINSEYSKLANSKYIAAFLNAEKASNLDDLEQDERRVLIELLEEIYNEFEFKKSVYDLIIKGNVYKLIAFSVRFNLIAVPNDNMNNLNYERMQKTLLFIEQNYMLDINLRDIAKLLNMNYAYTSRYFKALTGKTFKEYLDYIRICEADKLLINKSDLIYNIASKCGFKSHQAFNRVYKRLRGVSPKYRK